MDKQEKYERAKKRAKALRGFYRHLKVFVVINGLMYMFIRGLFNWTLPENVTLKPYYFDWFPLHLLIWGGIIGFHALIVFIWKPLFLDKWEARKIRELMENDREP